MLTNDEFYTKNDELCTKNDEFCIQKQGSLIRSGRMTQFHSSTALPEDPDGSPEARPAFEPDMRSAGASSQVRPSNAEPCWAGGLNIHAGD